MSSPTRSIGTETFGAIGYGAMGIAAFYGKYGSDEERLKVLDEAYARGCTFWDTADVYGDSEELIGKWFKRTGKRNDIFLCSKFGHYSNPDQPERLINGEPTRVREACDDSLRKLQVDRIDLYYLHRVDKSVPIEETVGAMAGLVKAGKVKYIGLCEMSAATLRRAHAVHPISAVEVEYSPFCLDIEQEKINVLKTARELGIKIVAYSPLGRGLLTGQYKSLDDFQADDFRKYIPRCSQDNFPQILALAQVLKRVGEKHNATAGQVAIAWVLAQGNDIIPIPGTKKITYLAENLDAVKVNLSVEDLAVVRAAAVEADNIPGPKYPPGWDTLAYIDAPPLKN